MQGESLASYILVSHGEIKTRCIEIHADLSPRLLQKWESIDEFHLNQDN